MVAAAGPGSVYSQATQILSILEICPVNPRRVRHQHQSKWMGTSSILSHTIRWRLQNQQNIVGRWVIFHWTIPLPFSAKGLDAGLMSINPRVLLMINRKGVACSDLQQTAVFENTPTSAAFDILRCDVCSGDIPR